MAVSETYLAGQTMLEMPGYIWVGYNRTDIHRNALKASGGVGVLSKTGLLNNIVFRLLTKHLMGY